MAEETKAAPSSAPAPEASKEEVVVADVPVAGDAPTVVEKETPPQPEPEPEKAPEEVALAAAVAEETEKEKAAAVDEKITESASFKEETNVAGELPDPQKKALDEFKNLVQEALNKHEFTAPPPPPPPAPKEEEKKPEPEAAAAAPSEEPKVEEEKKESEPESKTDEKKEAEEAPAPEVPPPVKEDPPKAKAEPEPVVETPATAESSEPAVVAIKVEEKAETADDDGAKTVEEIKETIVEVTNSTPAEPEAAAAPAEEPPKEEAKEVTEEPKAPEEVSIWGIPLLADERSDTILLKFLRARDFKVKDAFTMLKNVVAWRKEFEIEKLLEEECIGSGLEKVVYMHGLDKEGHPVCYNAYGEFQDKELYQNAFADAEKRSKFLRWRIQFLEKSIRKLDFSPDGVSTIVQVNDLKNSPGLFLFKKELRQATNQAVQLLQDNYPEFVAKQVFINVPWWYVAYNRMISPFLTQRTKSKFVFAGPSKTAETLFKYIAPEQVPVQYGGLSREGELEFTTADPATEETIKPSSKHTVEFPVTEACSLVWEVRVVGWEVSYGAEFVPSAEGGYTVIIQKSRKIGPTDEPVISDSYKIGEPGKVVLTFDNQSSKKKKLLYRSKTKPSD